MTCSNHPKTAAVATCAECGRPFCAECSIELDQRSWCRDCLARIVSKRGTDARVHPGWRKLAAALLSIIPGAGHMFLGLIGKGFALMGLLIASVFLIILYSDATGMYWMTAFLIPALGVLFLSYAVFDAMAISDARRSGRDLTTADDDTMKAVWERVLMNRRAGGWVLLIAGIVGILHLFSEPFSRWTMAQFSLSFPIAGLVIPVLLLIIGILLLRRSRKEK
jgi:TM2 domain-containing membrane protein YozV